jgi:hypothetical protein
MRTSILLMRKHGSEAVELLAGPDVPLNEQEKEFSEALGLGGVHPEIAELQRWDSDSGHQRTIKFEKPEQASARKEKIKKDFGDHAERQKPKKVEKPAKVTAKPAPEADAQKVEAPALEVAPRETPQAAEQPAAYAPKVDL